MFVVFFLKIRPPPRSTPLYSSAASDVYKRQPNKPGSLLSVLKPFDKRKINLSKIETRPSRGNINSHDFFVDCEGHIKDQKLRLAIKDVIDTGAIVRNFGSYPEYI